METVGCSAATTVAMLPNGHSRLTVEKHDELADLLQADPIHDVDEAMGWPIVRQDLQT